ncbi:fumarylacetoacetate hydrolase family protein [Microbacterium thalassium]|uniref:2-keto-4-pentenoate hydratase/2-oxohepta-3-ene-1,7-dioic acid hydratase in catechol pathway n=1 Tax=Microbacterium thalassium TaxID=362649 RepID=A0A7X0FND1_9MICO|nr:fumarylacetoacetate hydrolase family protein [Microbacterium thalassium]MBB6390703.1 2-keto-4-pentenoate hydratase/2-oxohepta-3-ene-1,7-dioic acid hydratase in catechol pathway [Microbacterium thalassium]
MRIANLAGRLALVTRGGTAVDVATASEGRFGPDPMSAYADWDAFAAWAAGADAAGEAFDRADLGPPVPRPPQIFAIGVNYREHADEAGYPPDSLPVTFTKFPSSLTGPEATVVLPDGNVDWEVELVVVIGRGGHGIRREDAWKHVAGFTVGQDLSERVAQLAGTMPQFSLAKSHPGFSPTGPWIVTPDELDDPADLAISCAIDDEVMQDSRTSRMIYDIPELIVRLSAVATLLPGDIIFSGTPSGIGNRRAPQRFLRAGETLTSVIEGVGELTTRFR